MISKYDTFCDALKAFNVQGPELLVATFRTIASVRPAVQP